MRPLVLAAAIAALACNRQPPAAQQPAPAPQAGAPSLKEFVEQRPEAAPTTEAIIIDDRALGAYMAFKRQMIDETRKAVTAMGDRALLRGGEPVRAAAQLGAESEAMAQRLEARRAALLREHGLGEGLVRAIDDLVFEVLVSRTVAAQGSGGPAAIAQMRQQLATLPADQRSHAEHQLSNLEKNLGQLENAKAARARFGDPAVDLVQRREAELSALQQDGVGMVGQ